MRPSRREFVKWVTASGIALSLSRLARRRRPASRRARRCRDASAGTRRPTAPGRIDGVAKVTGAKLYASDFRAADLPGWPAKTSHAMLVRAPDATHVYTGMDLARLSGALKPSVVVTADDLEKIGTRVPEFYAGDLFCPVGKTPLYLGQPVALLIFETFDAFDQARLALRDGTFVRFGEETGPVVAAELRRLSASPAWRARRPMRPTSIRRSRKAGSARARSRTRRCRSGRRSPRRPRRPTPRPRPTASRSAPSSPRRIRTLLVLDREFETQSVDPMFLEPEGGLAWYNGKDGKPRARARRAVALRGGRSRSPILLGKARAPFKPARINAQFAYLGGGFGGRDHTPFPLYVALAAMFFPGRPVRLAHDRYQQFQAGIKRHAFKMRSRIGVDRATGRIHGLRRRPCPGRRRARQLFAPASPWWPPPPRSASTTSRRSTSPRSRCIRAA